MRSGFLASVSVQWHMCSSGKRGSRPQGTRVQKGASLPPLNAGLGAAGSRALVD